MSNITKTIIATLLTILVSVTPICLAVLTWRVETVDTTAITNTVKISPRGTLKKHDIDLRL